MENSFHVPYFVREDINASERYKMVENPGSLGFGKYFSDHVFFCDYNVKRGWHNPRVEPYRPIEMNPGCSVLHYAQMLFEGMKAYSTDHGKTRLFRPEENWKRMSLGAGRLSMPAPTWEVFEKGLKALVFADRRWIPKDPQASLYLRPTLIATEDFLGVRPSDTYLFFIIGSPVGDYYGSHVPASGVSIWIESEHSRAAPGGVGSVKAAGNYATSLYAAKRAKEKGFSQVLWLDACRKELVEEVGTMNVFFKVGDEVWTPQLSGTILPGVTRLSVIEILRSWNIPIVEKNIPIKELYNEFQKGKVIEAFGTGTAAVITPIQEMRNDSMHFDFKSKPQELSERLKKKIVSIQTQNPQEFSNWVHDMAPEAMPEFMSRRAMDVTHPSSKPLIDFT